MNNLFLQLNYTVSNVPGNGKMIDLLIINNPDGSPRWIISADEKKPLFLKFYTVHNLRAAVFALVIRSIFFLRLQKLVFSIRTFRIASTGAPLFVDLFNDKWALFTGTAGPDRKVLVYAIQNKEGKFYKIGQSAKSLQLLQNEITVASTLETIAPQKFSIPVVKKISEKVMELNDLSKNAGRSGQMGMAHRDFIAEMYYKTGHVSQVFRLFKENDVVGKLGNLNVKNDERIPQGILRKLFLLLNSMKNSEVEVSMAHGDFTPWNCYVTKNNQLSVYDWEQSTFSMPVGFDAFHFMMQKGILAERKSWNAIYKEMKSTFLDQHYSPVFKSNSQRFHDYFKLYLVLNTTHYLDTYSKQAAWHPQIHWLINTWNAALTAMLQEVKCHRELFIMDTFDFLSAKNYAAIKFPEILPENLSEYSDIDVCIEKKDWPMIADFVKNHPLVAKCNVVHQSFMNTLHIVLQNGKFLSIDMIWELKRKSLVMMDSKKVLTNSLFNAYGIKRMSDLDVARYVGLFYGLNNAKVPQKYFHYSQQLRLSLSHFDQVVMESFQSKPQNTMLADMVKAQPYNNKKVLVINKVKYLVDAFRQLVSNKGFIITFSGVDGAGKSTIIERTKMELEKKLRRKVVVLRHRPSLLPILSAITKGKAKAEQEAAQRLPRQGANYGKLSSMLRFAYYFSDYIFGQFYVYLRYTRRGTVVLYDRYYFDFIVDSRRSNITIPEKFARFCYRLLMKPDLNFFLYADAATILKRKQELSAATIKDLSDRYKSLFQELGFSSKRNIYHAIENNNLDETISRIIKNTLTVAA